jgi:steroid 5-alpha reductase family enzyme
MDKLRKHSYILITLIYLLALLAAAAVYLLLKERLPLVWTLLVADIAATLVIWGFSWAYGNVSIYDPYWSVIPPVFLTFFAAVRGSFSLPAILLLIAVWYWGIRLTLNWAVTFHRFSQEDWRYSRFRGRLSPLMFQGLSLFGFQMMPTLVVFAGMMPGFVLLDHPGSVYAGTWAGFAICLAATSIQWISDNQSHSFRAAHPGEVCEAGLWKRGRHPNYFGEIAFWWGIWMMQAASKGFARPWLLIGPLAITALFLFVSIPMMEKRQLANKPGYAAYRQRTRKLI